MEFEWPALVVGLAMGLIALVGGWLFWKGIFRRPARQYWDERYPWYVRNLPFALGPIGGFFLFGSALALVTQLGQTWGALLGALVVLAVIGCLLLAIRWMRRPPRALKPEWLRAAELERPPPGDASGALLWFDRFFIGVIVGAAVLLGAIFVLLLLTGVLYQLFLLG
jgi:hypothetical protein